MSKILTQEEKNRIHHRFTEAKAAGRTANVKKYIFYRGWTYTDKTNWGEAVQEVLNTGAPEAKAALVALGELVTVLHTANGKLALLEQQHPHAAAIIESVSTSPVHRLENPSRLAVRAPVTAKSPIGEIDMILYGIKFAIKDMKAFHEGKHIEYDMLIDLWRLATGEDKVKPSPKSRLVQMLAIATDNDQETISKYLQRMGGQQAPKT